MFKIRKRINDNLKEKIKNALQEKKIFIGYFMLCRYLNGKGYIRYGCNAGYGNKYKPKGNPKNRLYPCPILCPDSKIYLARVRYFCRKLHKEKKIFLEKIRFVDSNNPHSKTEPHKKGDIFVIISLQKLQEEDLLPFYPQKNKITNYIN